MNKTNHPYHMVTISPWLILLSTNIMFFLISIIKLFYNYKFNTLMFSFIIMNLILYQWWRDIVSESTYQGMHTNKIVKNMKLGMILFIISEIFFLFLFFEHIFMYLYHQELKSVQYDLLKMLL